MAKVIGVQFRALMLEDNNYRKAQEGEKPDEFAVYFNAGEGWFFVLGDPDPAYVSSFAFTVGKHFDLKVEGI